VRLSSLERYAAAVDQVIDWRLGGPEDRDDRLPKGAGPARGTDSTP
jgi:hypothetical protein